MSGVELGGFAVEYTARSLVLLAIIAAVAILLRRRSAAAVYAAWRAGLAGILALLLLGPVLPARTMVVPWAPLAPALEAPDATPVWADLPARSQVVHGGSPNRIGGSSADGLGEARDVAWLKGFGLIWLIGSLVLLIRHASRFYRLARLASTLGPAPASIVRAGDRIANDLGVRSGVRFLSGAGVATPLVWGLRRSTVAMPPEASSWPRGELEAVLTHELAHVVRRDAWGDLLGALASAACWINPLVWWAWSRLRVEREHACDDVVLAGGFNAEDYAARLLEVARSATRLDPPVAAIAMGRPSELSARLFVILDPSRRREALSRADRARLAFVALAAFAITAVITPVAARAGVGAIATPASVNARCWAYEGRGRNLNRNSELGVRTAEWRTPECHATVRINGVFDLGADSLSIRRGEHGSLMIVVQQTGGTTVEFRAAGTGSAVEQTLTVNGAPAVPDDAARWLAIHLRELLRRIDLPLDRAE